MMEIKEAKQRLIWLDVLKGILVIFVILSHSYPPQLYRYFFTPFFLTMFFWASGYTFSLKNNFHDFILNKVKRLIIPFFVLGSARVVLAYVIEGGNLLQRIKGLLLQISCLNDEMWFVSCMFTTSIIFYIICRIRQKCTGIMQDIIMLVFSLLCLVIGMLDMGIWKIRCPWLLEIAGMMTFYMALGYLYKKYEERVVTGLNARKYIFIFSILYMILVFGFPNKVDIHSESFENPLLFLISSVVVIIPIIFVAQKFSKMKLSGILSFFGKNTLFYYAFGGSVRVILYRLFDLDGTENAYILSLTCTVLTMIILIIPAKIVKKYFPWMVGEWNTKLF